MANYTAYIPSVGGSDYPTQISNFITVSESFDTEIELARDGQTTLLDNLNTKLPLAGGTISGALTVTGAFTSSGNASITGTTLTIGVNDSSAGTLNVYGDGTASGAGGTVRVYAAADHDTTIDSWYMTNWSGSLYLANNTHTTAFVLNTGGNASFGGTVATTGAITEAGTLLSSKYLGISATAANAALLDNIDSNQFLRSDASDTCTSQTVWSTGSVGTIEGNLGSVGAGIEINSAVGNDAFITFHVSSDYAAHFGLDATTNDLAFGGWSVGASAHKIWHDGNTTASVNESASSIVQRDVSGYIHNSYFNMSADQQTVAPSRIAIETGTDGFLRWQTLAQFKTNLGLGFRGAVAFPTSSQTVLTSTGGQRVSCLGEHYDTDNIHDTTTNQDRLTVPAGVTKVRVKAQTSWSANTAGYRLSQFSHYNSAGTYQGIAAKNLINPSTSNPTTYFESFVMNVVAGDYFEWAVYQDSGTALSIVGSAAGTSSWMAMEIIE